MGGGKKKSNVVAKSNVQVQAKDKGISSLSLPLLILLSLPLLVLLSLYHINKLS
jgi:hypothetical protein